MKKPVLAIAALLGAVSFAHAADCLVLGDSLAVGVGQGLPRCDVVAKVGRTTAQIIDAAPEASYPVAILSAGSNDGSRASLPQLRALRDRVKANQVIWVVPASQFPAADMVRNLAVEYHDAVIHVDSLLGPDKVHPTPNGYKQVADQLRTRLFGKAGV